MNVVYVQSIGSRFARSQLRKSDVARSKDLILSFFSLIHTLSLHLCTAETTTSFSACVFDTSLQFCPLPSLLCTAPSVPPVHNNKKALCVFYIFCCHPRPLEIRGPFFTHGFSECQLPTHSWIQECEGGLRESSLWTIVQLCCSFYTAAVVQGRRMKLRNNTSVMKDALNTVNNLL